MVLIHDESSPTTYRFAMNVPEGGYTKVNSDGSATVYDKDGNAIRQVARPWAFDAAGRPQKTWYTVDENGDLIQHVEPAENALFPILADPMDNSLLPFGVNEGAFANSTPAPPNYTLGDALSDQGKAAIAPPPAPAPEVASPQQEGISGVQPAPQAEDPTNFMTPTINLLNGPPPAETPEVDKAPSPLPFDIMKTDENQDSPGPQEAGMPFGVDKGLFSNSAPADPNSGIAEAIDQAWTLAGVPDFIYTDREKLKDEALRAPDGSVVNPLSDADGNIYGEEQHLPDGTTRTLLFNDHGGTTVQTSDDEPILHYFGNGMVSSAFRDPATGDISQSLTDPASGAWSRTVTHPDGTVTFDSFDPETGQTVLVTPGATTITRSDGTVVRLPARPGDSGSIITKEGKVEEVAPGSDRWAEILETAGVAKSQIENGEADIRDSSLPFIELLSGVGSDFASPLIYPSVGDAIISAGAANAVRAGSRDALRMAKFAKLGGGVLAPLGFGLGVRTSIDNGVDTDVAVISNGAGTIAAATPALLLGLLTSNPPGWAVGLVIAGGAGAGFVVTRLVEGWMN
ncbi:hypothetical protein [Gordonia malaquae]|uniref:hypothetical protein n=1 Tax=Gordonia malaquae TaxID=410332 RepID=UPI0030FEF6A9